MKSLTKAKIINWHYFWNSTIDFKQIVFLTGKNASGKSTLIDALQLVLLGDTTGRFFNKAAMDKSARTLKGYLRGEIGDTAEGDFKYLRNGRFTSYIALEFYDDLHDSYFTMGIVFDTMPDGSEEHHFFSYDNKIPENEFVQDGYPMDYKTLSKYLSEHETGKFKFFDSNRQYQEFLKRKFGGLKDKYFSLLKKASSFSPITDITTFITEYVCDPQQNIELDALQENILQYKKLEKEAEVINTRVERLEDIAKTYDIYNQKHEGFITSQYIIEKSQLEISVNKLKGFKNELAKSKQRITLIDSELLENKNDVLALEERKIALIQDKANNNTLQITDDLKKQRNEIKTKISDIQADEARIKKNLETYCSNYVQACVSLVKKLSTFRVEYLDEERAKEIYDLEDKAHETLTFANDFKEKYLGNLTSLTNETLDEFREKLNSFKSEVSALSTTLARYISNVEKKITSLREEEKMVKEGEKSYEPKLVYVKRRLEEELKAKYGKDIPVELYADLVDIKDMSWSGAIEGFLYNQKFNLFVAPKYYIEAYKILKKLLNENGFFGTALVDQEKIIERDFDCAPGSLAEEIITDHEGARAYTNFLIGRLYKASDLDDARESGNGITKDCDLYRNYAFAKINPRLYRTSFIGRTLDERFAEEKQHELQENIKNLSIYRELHDVITSINSLEVINTHEISNIEDTIVRTAQLKGLRSSLEYIESELDEHDTTLIDSLDKRIDDVNQDIADMRKQKEDLLVEKGNLITSIKALEEEKIKSEEERIDQVRKDLEDKYDATFVELRCMPILEKELDEGKSYVQIYQEYSASLSRTQYVMNNVFTQLMKDRRDYCRDYHLSYNSESEDNTQFEEELVEFRDVRLPEYRDKITDSYNKATQQFKDDFIFKLRSAIEDVEDQIESLNEALKESSFGNDLYRFTVKPSMVYRRYYDMLKDDIILETGEDESLFIDKYKDVMEDLFRQITSSGENERNSQILENINKFTDYRSYLDFDLIVYNKTSGEEQRLSKMIKKKSGGETQTPFYISVLASFAQLYHVHSEGELSNTIRLIIFDEAFSKMDRERIIEAVKLLRRFNLQVILSTPPEKIGDISELVDETLLVSHDKNSSCVLLYSQLDN